MSEIDVPGMLDKVLRDRMRGWPDPLPECPCGQVHELGPSTRVAYGNIAAGLPPDVIIAGPEGAWRVPRIYLAAHGVKAAELPALAALYGFPGVAA